MVQQDLACTLFGMKDLPTSQPHLTSNTSPPPPSSRTPVSYVPGMGRLTHVHLISSHPIRQEASLLEPFQPTTVEETSQTPLHTKERATYTIPTIPPSKDNQLPQYTTNMTQSGCESIETNYKRLLQTPSRKNPCFQIAWKSFETPSHQSREAGGVVVSAA